MKDLKQKLTKTPLVIRVVSLYVFAGLVFWGGSWLATSLYPTPNLAAASSQVVTFAPKANITSRRIISGSPSRMIIERLNIDLSIEDGKYNEKTGEWSLSDKAVYFATMTDLPNDNRGNTFLYGHNRKSVIGRMSELRMGDIVKVQTRNGHEFSYSYTHDEVIKPDKTTVLYDNSNKPRLTVMTCEGVWSEARRLMYFDLARVD